MPSPRGLIQRLDQELHRSGLLPRCAKLLVAVSGGADSVALLRILHAINRSEFWRWRLVVAHVNHGIRGKSSDADARFVKSLARQLKLPFAQRTLRLGKTASEATARDARLRALKAIAKEKKCLGVLLAHHVDDQAETVLLRLIRGSGLDGLAGISSCSEVNGLRLYRPLLNTRRDALRNYLTEIGQSWREDETNATAAYLRNRVRADILPRIEALSERSVEAIGRAAQLAHEAQQFIEVCTRGIFQESLIVVAKKQITFKRKPLQSSPPILCGELLRMAVLLLGGSTESADFERTREAVRIIQASAGGKAIQMGRGIVIRVGSGTVTLEASR